MISTKGSMVLAGDPGPIKTRKQLTTSCLSLDLRRLAQKSRLIPSYSPNLGMEGREG